MLTMYFWMGSLFLGVLTANLSFAVFLSAQHRAIPMFHSNIFVFKEITTPIVTIFVHFKVADEDSDDHIVVDRVVDKDEHLRILAAS